MPLAAAVSGKATRLLGVPQGSAAQQAQEMVPEGVTVVSALHTVSAPVLGDLDHELDEDVLIAGDSKEAKAAVAELIGRIAGLRPVNAGRLEQARHIEALTPLLISVNINNKTHAGDPAHRPAGAPLVALLSGGTGGAKLARGLVDLGELAVVANTADDVEVYGVHVSPDPDLVTYWLADAIDERGYGIRGDTLRGARRARRRRAAHVVPARRPRPGDVPGPHRAAAGGARRSPRRTPRWSTAMGVASRGAADVRRAGGHLGALRRRLAAVPGVHDRRRRRRARGGRGAPRHRVRAADRGGARRARASAEAIVIGPSNPVISIGPILAVPGMREALAAARAPVVAVSPFVGGHAVKGPTESFCAQAGIELSAAGIVAAYDGVLDGDRGRRGGGGPTLPHDRHADGHPGRTGAAWRRAARRARHGR